ncbi:MAG: ParA family protein [Anaerofustis sp.]
MAKVICITNQKGGVGKTTSTACLAAGYRSLGNRVLCIDFDPQANLSFSCGTTNEEGNATIYDVVKGQCDAPGAIMRASSTFDMIPSNILLSGIELEFTNTGREYLLREALQPIMDRYDYILIDTPPALGILTVNALTACDYVIIPMLADIFSLQGIAQLAETISRVKTYCNAKIKVEGILLTKYNSRTILSREIKRITEMIASDMHTDVFRTAIRSSVVLMEVQANQENILDYVNKHTAIDDYMRLVNELTERGV